MEKDFWKKSRKFMLAMAFMTFVLFCTNLTVLAADSGEGEGSDDTTTVVVETSDGTEDDDDVDVSNVLVAPEGSATIVEQTTKSGYDEDGNEVNTVDQMVDDFGESEEDLTQENDIASYTVTTNKNLVTGEEETKYTMTETGQSVTLPDNAPTPDIESSTIDEPVGNVQTTTEITASENAIQKAIDVAFQEMESDATSITIVVSAGEYNGDITIDQAILAYDVDWDTFMLYIITEDSYTDTTESELIDKDSISTASDTGANVNGNISIDGVNVVLAGLYYSLETTISAKNSILEIYGTTQDDNINVVVTESNMVSIYSGDGNDSVAITSGGEDTDESSDTTNTDAMISTGNGDDTVTVDVSIASNGTLQANDVEDASETESEDSETRAYTLVIDGGDGLDRVHFTGDLAKESDEHSVTENADESKDVTLENVNEDLLAIKLIDLESFTDELANKAEIELTLENVFSDASDENTKWIVVDADSAFTNYVIDVNTTNQDALVFGYTDEDGNYCIYPVYATGDGFLTSIVITYSDTGVVFEIISDLVIYDEIYAPTLNVTIEGKNIELGGDITVQNLIVKVHDDDSNVTISEEGNELSAEDLGIDTETFEYEVDAFSFGVMNPEANVSITVNEDVTITSSGAIVLQATVTQDQGFIPFVDGANIVIVKVGNASIDIYGTLIAGTTIDITSLVEVVVVASNASLASAYVPLAVQISINNNVITIHENAELIAVGSITIGATTTNTITTSAATGALPLAIALSVLITETGVVIYGDITSYDGNINVTASNTSTVKTSATLGVETTEESSDGETGSGTYEGGSESSSNLFLAVAVAIQDTYVNILGDANLTAGNNITISSTSNLVTTTKAVATDSESAGTASDKTQSSAGLSTIAKYLFTLGKTYVTADSQEKLDAAEKYVSDTEGYTITVNSTENGSVSAISRAYSGDSVSLGITPADGYSVDTVTIKYLESGASSYTTKTITVSDGAYTFVMPTAKVEVTVTFKYTGTTGDSYSGTTGTTSALDALESTQDSTLTDTTTPSENAKAITNISVFDNPEDEDGVVIGAIVSSVELADEGTTVTVIINPSSGYRLVENSLYVIYDMGDAGTISSYERLLTQNDNGEYYFIMPAAAVTFKAEFEKIPSGETDTSVNAGGETTSTSGGLSGTGAIAIGVTFHDNNAYINTTGNISAGGKVTVNAEALTQNSLTADASAVSNPTYDPTAPVAEASDEVGVVHAEQTGKQATLGGTNYEDVTITATKYGAISITETIDDKNMITATPETGYVLDSLKLSYTLDGSVKTVTLSGSGDYYDLASGTTIPEGATDLKIIATFIGNPHTITTVDLPTGISVVSSAKAGETVTIVGVASDKMIEVTGVMVSLVDGSWQFTMPDEDITLTITLVDKAYEIQVAHITGSKETAEASTFVTVQATANTGDSVSLTLSDTARVSAISYALHVYVVSSSGSRTELTLSNGTFTMPTTMAEGSYILIEVDDSSGSKDGYQMVAASGITNGTITPTAIVISAETVEIIVTPDAGYMLKENSLIVDVAVGTKVTQYTVTADENGKYYFTTPILAEGSLLTVNATFEVDPNYDSSTGTGTSAASSSSSFGVGIGVGVTYTAHENNAIIENGTIEAESLSVTATSGDSSNKLLAQSTVTAGYSEGDISITGAISVQITGFLTNAMILEGTDLTLDGGTLEVTATSYETIKNTANASGNSSITDTLGVGAGIAVSVTGIDVIARVADNVFSTKQADLIMDSITISVEHSGEEYVTAKAGSAGGISVTPVVVVLVSGVNATAELGTQEVMLTAENDINVKSYSTMYRETSADASAVGGSVGFGGSFNITVLNDSATATVNTSTTSNNLNVKANSRTSLKMTTKASSKGSTSSSSSSSSTTTSTTDTSSTDSSSSTESGSSDDSESASEDGESDQQADGLLNNVTGLAGQTGSSNVSSSSVSSMTTDRQTAQTSEGNVQVAAAFALNIMSNGSYATIGDGVTTITTGNLTVSSENMTDAKVTSNASATQSEIGVGVAVAINMVTIDNMAILGSGSYKVSGDLTVSATMAEEFSVETITVTNSDESQTVFGDYIEEVMQSLVEDMLEAMGVDDEWIESIADVVSEVVKDAAEYFILELLEGTGLENLVSPDIRTNIDEMLSNFTDDITTEIQDAAVDFVTNAVISLLAEKFGLDIDSVNDSSNGLQSLDELAIKELQSLANEIFEGVININQLKTFLFSGDMATTLKDNLLSGITAAGKVLATAALDSLSNLLDLGIEEEDAGPTYNITTTAIAGAGASSVGVAGSVAVSVLNGTTTAQITNGSSDSDINVGGTLTLYAEATHNEDTVASAAVGDDGAVDTNASAGGDSDVGTSTTTTTEVEGSNGKRYITSSTGATVNTFTVDSTGKIFTVTITPTDGYEVTGATITRDDTGATVDMGTGTYNSSTGVWTFTKTMDDLSTDAVLTVVATYNEVTYTVTVTQAATGGNIYVNTSNSSTATTSADEAAEGDRLYVRFLATDGYTLDTLSYTYVKSDGTTSESITIDTYETVGGNVLVFVMPEGNVTITVTFRALNSGESSAIDTATTPTTAAGTSVGVGAGFAFTYSEVTVTAGIGEDRTVEAGAVDIRAIGNHSTTTTGIAGSDPLAPSNSSTTSTGLSDDTAKDISLDASVAVNYVTNNIVVFIGEGTNVVVLGTEEIVIREAQETIAYDPDTYLPMTDEDGNYVMETLEAEIVSFYMLASQNGDTLTKASSFAVGEQTAVGASVAVNIVESNVLVDVYGNITVKQGGAEIEAYTYNEDVVYGIATAMGADIARYAEKFQDAQEEAGDTATQIAQGTYTFPSSSSNSDNTTATTINSEVDNNAADGGTTSSNDTSLSSNILGSQDVSTTSTDDETITTGTDTATAQTGESVDSTSTSSTSVQVAASVGLNITEHKATVTISGDITSDTLNIYADNDGNFSTKATGAAMSLATSSNAVAAGVAISINNNEALVIIGGNITTTGDLDMEAQLSQNMDGIFLGLLGAQALAGSVSGDSATATVSGAFAIIVSNAETQVQILEGTTIEGGNVIIAAYDKSKLATRAGGVSISKGTSVGIGASFSIVYANNVVEVLVGDNVTIKADDLTIQAEKYAVTIEDYSLSLGLEVLLTDSTGLTAGTYTPGVVDIKKDTTATDSGYTITFNFSTETVVSAIDLLNFLSSNNYYVEAVAGAISGGASSDVSLAGSMAIIYYTAITSVTIGNNVTIIVTGDTTIEAIDSATARIIAGSLSVAPATAGIGVTVASLTNTSTVTTYIGESANITTGTYKQSASVDNDFMVITIAASVSTSATGNAVGGTINTVVMNNTVESIFGGEDTANVSTLDATGDIYIGAASDGYILLPTLAAAGTSGSGVAAGGTIVVIVDNTDTLAKVASNTVINSKGAFTLEASNMEKFVVILAAVSGSTSGTAVAGALSTLISTSETEANVGSYTTIHVVDDIQILAISDITVFVAAVSAAGSTGTTAGGATIVVNVMQRNVSAIVGDYVTFISEAGNILVSAVGTDWQLTIAISASGASGNALSGVILVNVSENNYLTEVGKEAELTAGDSIGIMTDLDSQVYLIAGALGGSGTTAVGATLTTAVQLNTLETIVNDGAILTAYALTPEDVDTSTLGVKTKNRELRRRGITVSSYATEDIVMISVSGAASGTTAVTGVVNTLVVQNIVTAKVSGAILNASGSDIGVDITDEDPNNTVSYTSSSDVVVEAVDETFILDLAGALSASGSIGVGATVVVLTFEKEVTAVAENVTIDTTGDVEINASTTDDLILLGFAIGASGVTGVAGDINVLVFNSTTQAILGTKSDTSVNARNVTVYASSDASLYNIAASIAGSGTTAVGAVLVVTYFTNTTKAIVQAGSNIYASGDVIILAESNELVTADAVGVAASGVTSVGGTVDVIITKVITEAYTEDNVTITAGGDVTISAVDTYDIVAIVITVSASGGVAVSVTALVSVSYNTIKAQVGANNTITGYNVNVYAQSNRDIITAVTGVTGSGATAVGVALSVVISGSQMSQDGSDALNSSDLDIVASVAYALSLGDSRADTGQTDDLESMLSGDGQNIETEDFTDYAQENEDGEDGAAQDAIVDDAYYVTLNGDLRDSTSAVIVGGTITATNDMNIISYDNVKATMVSVVVAGSGGVAVGVSISLGLLYSNAYAIVGDDATLSAGGTITVKAVTGQASSDYVKQDTTDIEDEIATLLAYGYENGDEDDPITLEEDTPINLISINVAGAGAVGVSVDLAVLLLFSTAQAQMSGTITGATNVAVESGMYYNDTKVVMVGIAGSGGASVVVETAMVYFAGESIAAINGNAKISGVTGTISILNSGDISALASYGALAGSAGVGVTVGIAMVINRTTVRTYIDGYVVIDATDADVYLHTNYYSTANIYAVGMAAGTVGVVVTVATIVNKLDALTYIGVLDSEATGTGSVSADYIWLNSSINSDVRLTVVEVSVAGVAVNAGVAVGYNQASGIATINRMNITANNILVNAYLKGNMTIEVISLSGGLVAVGATVAVAVQETHNEASIDATGRIINVSGDIRIIAGIGDETVDSVVEVTVITGTAAVAALAVNSAVATNSAVNIAELRGDGGIVYANNLTIYANGNSRAYAIVGNVGASALGAYVSSATAVITSEQYAVVSGSLNIYLVGDLLVQSVHNLGTVDGYTMLYYGDGDTRNQIIERTQMAEAYVFSATVSLGSLTSNIAIATANATSVAGVTVYNLDAEDISIQNNANSTAVADADNLSASFASVGVMVAYAYANGTYITYLVVSNAVNGTGNIDVLNNYRSVAYATVTPSNSGVDASISSAELNIAVAEVNTFAYSYISGSGTITADVVTIYSNGKALAVAEVNNITILAISAVSLTSNMAIALLNALQDTFIQGVTIYATEVTVLSLYNVTEATFDTEGMPNDATPDTNYGAYATIGAAMFSTYSVSLEISLISVEANSANAYSDSIVNTYIRDASIFIDEDGTITVVTFASSIADATINTPDAVVNLAYVAISIVTADASGVYTAFIESDNSSNTIETNQLIVAVKHYTLATASTGPLGGASVSVSGASITANMAVANVTAYTTSYIKGNALTLITTGDVIVTVSGFASANAQVITDTISITLLNIAANITEATLYITQVASVSVDEAIMGGDLSISSYFVASNGTKTGAYAYSGTVDMTSTSITFISGTMISSEANAYAVSEAYIYGDTTNIVIEGDLLISATSDIEAVAVTSKPNEISAASISYTSAITIASGLTKAYIEQADIMVGGSVLVVADSNKSSEATSASGYSVTFISGKAGNVEASIGAWYQADVVEAYISSNAKVVADGDVDVLAYSSGTATARMTEGFELAVITVEYGIVSTYSNYSVTAQIASGATVYSNYGSVTVEAYSYGVADSLVDGSSIGLLLSADYKYAVNEINQNVSAVIGENVTVYGYKGVNIYAFADVDMTAKTMNEAIGLLTVGTIQAYNILNRSVVVDITSGAVIESFDEDINIIASNKIGDQVLTFAYSSNIAAISYNGINAITILSIFYAVNIYQATVTNVFGAVNIYAIMQESGYLTESYSEATGFVVGGTVVAQLGTTNIQPSVTTSIRIIESDVTGNGINIYADFEGNLFQVQTFLDLAAWTSSSLATASITLSISANVEVKDSKLTSYGDVNIYSSIYDETGAYAALCTIFSSDDSLSIWDSTEAEACINVLAYVTATIDGSTITANNFYAYIFDFDESAFNCSPEASLSNIVNLSKAYSIEVLELTLNATVNNTIFILGSGAAGILIELTDDPEDVRVIGGTIDVTYDYDENTYTIGSISSTTSSYILWAAFFIASDVTVYASGIQEITVYNHSQNKDVAFSDISLITEYEENVLQSVYFAGGSYTIINQSDEDTDACITIISSGSGNVYFNDNVWNEYGSMWIEWTSEENGSVYVTEGIYFITQDITIINAKNIGGAENSFTVYLATESGSIANVNIDATGNGYIEMILTEMVSTDIISASTSVMNGSVYIENMAFDGDLNLVIESPIQLNHGSTINVRDVSGGVYLIGAISAENVDISIEDALADIRDNTYENGEITSGDIDILATDGNITLRLYATSSLNNPESEFIIELSSPNGYVEIMNIEDETIIDFDIFIYIYEGDFNFGDRTLSGSELTVIVGMGDIIGGDVVLDNESSLVMYTGVYVIYSMGSVSSYGVTSSSTIWNIEFNTLKVTDDSSIWATVYGNFVVIEETMTATSSITVDNGSVWLSVRGNFESDTILITNESDVYIYVNNTIQMKDINVIDNGDISVYLSNYNSNNSIYGENINVVNSTLTLVSLKDIQFEDIYVASGDLSISANGSISVEQVNVTTYENSGEEKGVITLAASQINVSGTYIQSVGTANITATSGDVKLLGEIDLTNTVFNITAGNDVVMATTYTQNGGTTGLTTAVGDVTILESITLTNKAQFTIYADGNVELYDVDIATGNLIVDAGGDMIIPNLAVATGIVDLDASNIELGTVDFTRVAFEADAESILITGTYNQNGAWANLTATNGDLTIQGPITLNYVDFDARALGEINLADIDASNSDITLTTRSDANVGSITGTNTDLAITTAGNTYVAGIDLTTGNATIYAIGDAQVDNLIVATGNLIVDAGGDVIIPSLVVATGIVDIDASNILLGAAAFVAADFEANAENIFFNSIVAKESNISLLADDTIGDNGGLITVDGVETQGNYIKFADDDSNGTEETSASLTLTGNIGSEATPLILDIPELVVVQMPAVGIIAIQSMYVTLYDENGGIITVNNIPAQNIAKTTASSLAASSEEKALNLEITGSTDDVILYNQGDINILQNGVPEDVIYIKNLYSANGNVSVIGSGDIAAVAGASENIFASGIILQAPGNVGTSDNPLYINRDSATGNEIVLDVAAGNEVALVSLIGDVLGSITSGADTMLEVQEGSAGTESNPLNTDVAGTFTVYAKSDIVAKQNTDNDLSLIVNSEEGSVYVETKANLDLSTSDGYNLSIKKLNSGGTTSITTKGNLDVDISNDFGTQETPIDVNVDGVLDVKSNGDINMTSEKQIVFNNIEGNQVTITSEKGISGADEDNLITADSLVLIANNNIGSSSTYLNVVTDKLSAATEKNIYINGYSDIEIEEITAGGNVKLNVDGDITASPDSTTHITADKLTITTTGDIGTTENSLKVAVNTIVANGVDMVLEFMQDTMISKIIANTLNIVSYGNITADPDTVVFHIIANSVRIYATGQIGTEDVRLRVITWLSGIYSEIGKVFTYTVIKTIPMDEILEDLIENDAEELAVLDDNVEELAVLDDTEGISEPDDLDGDEELPSELEGDGGKSGVIYLGIAGILLILFFIFWFVLWKRRKKEEEEEEQQQVL